MRRWINSARRQTNLDSDPLSGYGSRFGSEQLDPTSKPERVRQHFAKVARRYDLMNTLLSLGLHHIWKRRAVDLAEIRPGARVLDLCGGTGDLVRLARESAEGEGVFTVCDFTRPMMQVGREKSRQRREEVAWIEGDAECLPVCDSGVDAVLLGFGIRNLTDPGRGIAEIYRVLRPGGRLMCLEFSRPLNPVFRAFYDLYSFSVMPLMGRLFAGSGQAYLRLAETIRMFPVAEELSRLFREHGFQDTKCLYFTNGVAVAHLARKPV